LTIDTTAEIAYVNICICSKLHVWCVYV